MSLPNEKPAAEDEKPATTKVTPHQRKKVIGSLTVTWVEQKGDQTIPHEVTVKESDLLLVWHESSHHDNIKGKVVEDRQFIVSVLGRWPDGME